MTDEELTTRMINLSDGLFARASEFMNEGTEFGRLIGTALMIVSVEIADAFEDIGDCEGEA